MDNLGFGRTIGLWQIYGSADDRWAGPPQMGNSTLGCLVNDVPARQRDVVFQNYALYPHMSKAHRLRVTDAKLTPTQFENG